MAERSVEEMVGGYLSIEREGMAKTDPLQHPVCVRWRGRWRVGGIAELRADGICFLSLATYQFAERFVMALRHADPARLVYEADHALDLTGRHHVVVRAGDRLMRMDPAQSLWAKYAIGDVLEPGGGRITMVESNG